jgi:hypothetical protein
MDGLTLIVSSSLGTEREPNRCRPAFIEKFEVHGDLAWQIGPSLNQPLRSRM